MAGNVCPGDFVKIYLPGNSTDYPSGENGSEVVTVVEGEGIRVPGGRYHHATVLILVRCHSLIQKFDNNVAQVLCMQEVLGLSYFLVVALYTVG